MICVQATDTKQAERYGNRDTQDYGSLDTLQYTLRERTIDTYSA